MANSINTDQSMSLSSDLSSPMNVRTESFDINHEGKEFCCDVKRTCASAQSIIMYDKAMDAKAKFVVNKALTKLTLSGSATDQEISQLLENDDHIAVEHYINYSKETVQSSSTVNLKDLLKMYPEFIVDIIKNDVDKFANKLGKELQEKDNIVSKMNSFTDFAWKHETIKEKTVTIVKCIQKSSEDGIFKVNLTFTTIDVDLMTWRCTWIKGTSGKQTLGVRDIQLLVNP